MQPLEMISVTPSSLAASGYSKRDYTSVAEDLFGNVRGASLQLAIFSLEFMIYLPVFVLKKFGNEP